MSPALGSVSDGLCVSDVLSGPDKHDDGVDIEGVDVDGDGAGGRGGRGVYRRAICSCGCLTSTLQIEVEKRWA